MNPTTKTGAVEMFFPLRFLFLIFLQTDQNIFCVIEKVTLNTDTPETSQFCTIVVQFNGCRAVCHIL